MGEITSCPYGCAVRWNESDIRWWFEHIQRIHRERLPEWIKSQGFWGSKPIKWKTPVLYGQRHYKPSDEEMGHLASLIDEDSPESQRDPEEIVRYLRKLAEKYPEFR